MSSDDAPAALAPGTDYPAFDDFDLRRAHQTGWSTLVALLLNIPPRPA